MRVLKPEIAEERKRRLLQWVIHRYMKTSAPVSSKAIADEGKFKLSPATIRNALKELEDEGYLFQEHTSAGRVPTDKGYRLYVDYLVEAQRLAAQEKQHIESEYSSRVAELDELLAQTSRMLSSLSHSAGFALSPRLGQQPVRRLELVPLGPRHVLVVLVTESGLIRHWPLELPSTVSPDRLGLLSRFLNENLNGMNVQEIRDEIYGKIEAAEREFRELGQLVKLVLKQVAHAGAPDEMYLDGAMSLASLPSADPGQLRSLLSVVEDKKRLAHILAEEFQEQLKLHARRTGVDKRPKVQVRIGDENRPELRSLSLVTTTYEVEDKLVGLLGILGPRHMEYPKMIALVNFVGAVVSETLSRWEEVYGNGRP
jgi:heat-inducible transcriptional repressor